MADLEISNLPAVTIPLPTDELAMVNDLVTKRITRAQMHSLALGEILLLPNGADASTPEIQFPNSGIYENLSDELAFSQGGVNVGNLTTPALGGMLINNTLTGSGLERVLTLSDIGSFGEYVTTFDATVGTFPVTSNQGDWFNCTVAGTIGGQAFIVGDILVALIDNPSTTVFAANWTIVPHIGISTLGGLSDVDLTGQANNDLLFRSGGIWIDTAGLLTWDGSNLSATNIGGIPEANLLDKDANETITGTRIHSRVNSHIQLRGTTNADPLDTTFFDRNAGNILRILNFDNSTSTFTSMMLINEAFAVTWPDVVSFDISAPLTATSYGGILEANLLSRNAVEDITGAWSFSSTLGIKIAPPSGAAVLILNGFGIANPAKFLQDTARNLIIRPDDTVFDDDLLWTTGGGWAFDKTLNVAGALTATTYGGILEANLLSRTVSESVAGAWIFAGNKLEIQGTSPRLLLNETDGPVDEKFWRSVATGGQFRIEAINDAFSVSTIALTIDRTSTVIDAVNILAPLTVDGPLFLQERAAAAADVTGDGQFWVRNDIPNTPMFTDDAGTDFVLNASGSGATLTRINATSGAAGADLTWQQRGADTTKTNNTLATVMTTTNVGVGTWTFKYTIIYQSAATGTGVRFGIGHSGTVGEYVCRWTYVTTGSTTTTGIADNTTTIGATAMVEGKAENVLGLIGGSSAGVEFANTNLLAICEGILVVTATGSMTMQFANESGSSTVTFKGESSLELKKIA